MSEAKGNFVRTALLADWLILPGSCDEYQAPKKNLPKKKATNNTKNIAPAIYPNVLKQKKNEMQVELLYQSKMKTFLNSMLRSSGQVSGQV